MLKETPKLNQLTSFLLNNCACDEPIYCSITFMISIFNRFFDHIDYNATTLKKNQLQCNRKTKIRNEMRFWKKFKETTDIVWCLFLCQCAAISMSWHGGIKLNRCHQTVSRFSLNSLHPDRIVFAPLCTKSNIVWFLRSICAHSFNTYAFRFSFFVCEGHSHCSSFN